MKQPVAMALLPTASVAPTISLVPLPPRRRWPYVAGYVYLGLSLTCSFWYVRILTPSMENDFFWGGFNGSVQAFIMDAVNTLHLVSDNDDTAIPLTSAFFAQTKVYDDSVGLLVNCLPTYPRKLLYTQLTTDLALHIASIRIISPVNLMWITTQYCWVDFHRTFELAHTAARQARCSTASYTTNGAIYLEAMLRNTNMDDFYATLGGDGGEFTVAIVAALEKSATGAAWLTSLLAPHLTVADEAAWWRAQDITRWQLQYQNWKQTGISDTVAIASALGYMYNISTNVVPYSSLTYQWTTVYMYSGMYNDMRAAQSGNFSLVRGDMRFAPDLFEMQVFTNTALQIVVHNHVGPLNSIDLYIVAPPAALLEFGFAFQATLQEARLTRLGDAFHRAWQATQPTLEVMPRIHAWTVNPAWQFVGGSPLCNYNSTTSFVQAEWGFDDLCVTPRPMTVPWTRSSLLFAIVATRSDGILDNVCAIADAACMAMLQSATRLYALWEAAMTSSPVDADVVHAAVASLHDAPVEVVQFAVDALTNASVLLRQPLLDASDPVFSFLGWTMLFDWMDGTREVVSYEGDTTTLRLISYQYSASISLTPNLDQMPRDVGGLFVYGVWYVSCVSAAVVVAMTVASVMHGEWPSGVNLLQFSRVASFTWVGRPLLALRGVTAIALASSSTTQLVTVDGFTFLAPRPRAWWESVVVASEVTWVAAVVVDLCLVLNLRRFAWSAPLSTVLVFIVALVLERSTPMELLASSTRTCIIIDLDANIFCQGSVVLNGSYERVLLLVAAALLGTLTCACLGHVVPWSNTTTKPSSNLLYPGSAAEFLEPNLDGSCWLDCASHIMCGVLVLKISTATFIFDVKSWLVCSPSPSATSHRVATCHATTSTFRSIAVTHPYLDFTHRLYVVLSMVYVGCTLAGSLLYMSVLESKLSNDVWWTGFNTSAVHVYVARMSNALPYIWTQMAHDTSVLLDEPAFALANIFNKASTNEIIFSMGKATTAKFQFFTDLPAVIRGLRGMDGCHVPYIATQFCWLDFGRTWEMASTAKRQSRCLDNEISNAAVYVESILRNIDVNAFVSCWGDAFTVGVMSDLEASNQGQQWLDRTLRTTHLSIDDEVIAWRAQRLVTFDVQWQNYKLSGLLETIQAQNALGANYALSLKQSNGTWRFDDQTSFKMYWSWGSDLWAVGANESTIVPGASLLRSSPRFAFLNSTIEGALMQNGTLPQPLPSSGVLFHNTFGPYGSVDLKHVPIPATAQSLFNSFSVYVNQLLFENATALMLFSTIPSQTSLAPTPHDWTSSIYTFLGGNPLCIPAAASPAGAIGPYFGLRSPCSQIFQEASYIGPIEAVVAVLASNYQSPASNGSVCRAILDSSQQNCVRLLQSAVTFIDAYLVEFRAMYRAEMDAVEAVVSKMNVSLFQFAQVESSESLVVLRVNAFGFHRGMRFWGWSYLYQWHVGEREVLTLTGDDDAITLLSTVFRNVAFTLNPAEIPHSLSLYFLRGIQYVTAILVVVSTAVLALTIVNRGYIEPWNMLKLSRIGGIVWVGRPLLALRAISAMCLLCTGPLELVVTTTSGGSSSKFASRPPLTYLSALQTILISGEVTWLAYVLSDILSLLTKQYTRSYMGKSSMLLWAVSATLHLVWPLHVSTTLRRVCHGHDLDFHVVCNAGVIYIGRYDRFFVFLYLALGCTGLCYLVERVRRPRLAPCLPPSRLLYSLAVYTYPFERWTLGQHVYVDMASAFLNGLICMRHGPRTYILDVKTWRVTSVPTPTTTQDPRFDLSLPLTLENALDVT
ncbi:Aste57867_23811 [Aphanomyces stellatus]|uniref:Aste57867_23811 protein n=1 Tax=Aphanomyces stellatus TaxID=120398 RepID=A0A485LPH1_9STRA|nr:hypothetical protein As57867_023738 [Aphanomyces stellatus]VFU00455.1 Aste57867_23811 [Aphanomyces stellatus]